MPQTAAAQCSFAAINALGWEVQTAREDRIIADQPNNAAPLTSRSLRGDVVFTLGLLLALYVCWLVRDVLLIVYLSALFAVILSPVLEWISSLKVRGREPSRAVAVGILFVAVVGGLGAFFFFALPPVVHDLREFVRDLPTRGPILLERVNRLPFANRVDLSAVPAHMENAASTSARYIVSSLPTWAGRVFDMITTLVLMVYFMLEGESTYQWFLSFFPTRPRRRLDATLRRADVRIGKWLLAQGSLMLILWLASTIVFAFMHLRYYYLLGVLMGLANIIPVAGGLATIALAAVVAAIDSWSKVLGVIVFYLVYMQIENAYLTPRIMSNRVNLSGIAVIIALLFGASFAGVAGALVAVPTAALVAVLVDEYLVQRDVPAP